MDKSLCAARQYAAIYNDGHIQFTLQGYFQIWQAEDMKFSQTGWWIFMQWVFNLRASEHFGPRPHF